MKRKIITVILMSLLLLTILPVHAVKAYSYQDFLNNCSAEYKTGEYFEELKKVLEEKAPSMAGTADLVIEVAESQIGYYEGNNSSQLNGEYQGSGDYTEYGRYYDSSYIGSSWCNFFVHWVLDAAGVERDKAPKNPFYVNVGVGNSTDFWRNKGATIFSWKNVKENNYDLKKGDIIIYGKNSSSEIDSVNLQPAREHIAIFVEKKDGKYLTIDGNTSDENPNQGVCVKDKWRSFDSSTGKAWGSTYVYAVVRPNYVSSCNHLTDPNSEIKKTGYCSEHDTWLPIEDYNYKYNQDGSLFVPGTYKEKVVNGSSVAIYRNQPYKSSPSLNINFSTVEVIGCVKNGLGNVWYKVKNGTNTYYCFSENLEFVSPIDSTLSINPEHETYTIQKGTKCDVRGTISSNYNITRVTATLNGTKYVDKNPNSKSFDIGTSSAGYINSFKGAELPVGDNYIIITATDTSGKTIPKTITIKVVDNSQPTPTTYQITYNANDGVGVPNNQTKTQGVPLYLSTTIPTREHHTFLGYSTYLGGPIVYQPGDAYTADSGATLYANWAYNYGNNNSYYLNVYYGYGREHGSTNTLLDVFTGAGAMLNNDTGYSLKGSRSTAYVNGPGSGLGNRYDKPWQVEVDYVDVYLNGSKETVNHITSLNGFSIIRKDLYYTSEGALTTSASGNTLLVKFANSSDTANGSIASRWYNIPGAVDVVMHYYDEHKITINDITTSTVSNDYDKYFVNKETAKKTITTISGDYSNSNGIELSVTPEDRDVDHIVISNGNKNVTIELSQLNETLYLSSSYTLSTSHTDSDILKYENNKFTFYNVNEDINIDYEYHLFDNIDNSEACAVLTSDGRLIFFRTNNDYKNDTYGTYYDIYNNNYVGTIYTGIETFEYEQLFDEELNCYHDNIDNIPWHWQRDNIQSVQIASDQIIKPISTAYWFAWCDNLNYIDLNGLDTSNVKTMHCMFYFCQSLSSLDISSFDTRNVESMDYLFYGCESLMSINLGSNFKWIRDDLLGISRLPYGLWTNGQKIYTSGGLSENWDSSLAGTWYKSKDDSFSKAYAVLENDGTLLFFRSTKYFENNTEGLFTDVYNNEYYGTIYLVPEDCSLAYFEEYDWRSKRDLIRKIEIASNQTIKPLSTKWWFCYLENLESVDLQGLDTSETIDMWNMFIGCSSLIKLDLSSFDTKNVANMGMMFRDCTSLTNLDLSSFDTKNVIDMRAMFFDCTSLTSIKLGPNFNWVEEDNYLPTGNWTNGSITYTAEELHDNWNFSLAGTWLKGDAESVKYLGEAYGIIDEEKNLTLFRSTDNYLGSAGAVYSDVAYDIYGNKYIGHIITDIESDKVLSPSYNDSPWGNYGIKTFKIANNQKIKPKTTAEWFSWKAPISVDLTGLDCSEVTNMTRMFYESRIIELDLSPIDTSNVADMSYMFADSRLVSINLSSFDTRSVTNMSHMFSGCRMLTSLDLSSFDTSNVTNMSGMFMGCELLSSLNLSSFNTSKVTDMSDMFRACKSFTSLDLSSFDTSNVKDMSTMFYASCWYLYSLDLSSFNTSNVESMGLMFGQCASLVDLDISSFDCSNLIRDGSSRFDGLRDLLSINLGPKFIWRKNEKLPSGNWTNGSIAYTAEELRDNWNSSLAGTWKKIDEKVSNKVANGTLEQNGTISLKVTCEIDESVDRDNAYVLINNEKTYLKDLDSDGDNYSLKIPQLSPKHLSDNFTVTYYDENDKPISNNITISVKSYINTLINDENTSTKAKTFYKSLLNYAANAQEYFGFNTEDLANSELLEADKDVSNVNKEEVAEYTPSIAGVTEGIRAFGQDLNLSDEINYRVYFQLEDGYNINEYVFTLDGVNVQPQKYKDNLYYVNTKYHAAPDLGVTHNIAVARNNEGSLNVSVSVISYAHLVLRNEPTSTSNIQLQNLMKSLYLYYNNAKQMLEG